MALILIVDDNQVIHDLLTGLLDSKYNLIHAYTADAAWDIIKLRNPDLVISDINMPGSMDGLGLLNTIKTSAQFKNLPVIMISGSGGKFIAMSKSVSNGAEDFFTKPFRLPDITHAVELALAENESV